MKNQSEQQIPRDGYDLPVYGLEDGLFYVLHVSSVVCIIVSFICALALLVKCIRLHGDRPFFKWTECDRIIIYLAICDGCFNLSHGTDHMQVIITRTHVQPPILCQAYGFMTSVFCTSQNILVGIIAINIFSMMYFRKKLQFGRYDWILLVVTYGIPAGGGIAAWCFGFLGPNGVICLTDGVKGRTIFIFFFTIPLLWIFTMNTVLYLLTWLKIRSEIKYIHNNLKNLGCQLQRRKTVRRVAKSMSLFVAAFFVQWWAAGLFGALGLFGIYPKVITHASTIFSNLGGILNLCVYILINKRRCSPSRREHKRERRRLKNHGSEITKDDLKNDSNTCEVYVLP